MQACPRQGLIGKHYALRAAGGPRRGMIQRVHQSGLELFYVSTYLKVVALITVRLTVPYGQGQRANLDSKWNEQNVEVD